MAVAMPPWALGALRLLVAPAALVWLLGSVGRMSGSHTHVVEPALLVLALLVNQLTLAIFAARLRWVLALCAVHIGPLAALRIHLQSMFYFFLVPMTVGLELARFVKIRAIRPSASVAHLTAALLLDRLLGAGSALAVVVLCLPYVLTRMTIAISSTSIGIALGLCAVLGGAVMLWPRARRVLIDVWRLTHGKRLGFACLFVLSMAMHALFALGCYLAIRSLGLPIGFGETVFAVAGGMLLVAVPVSVAGVGAAEAGSAGLFIAFGYPPSVALIGGSLPYLARLIAAFEGGLWEILEGSASAVAATRQLLIRDNLKEDLGERGSAI